MGAEVGVFGVWKWEMRTQDKYCAFAVQRRGRVVGRGAGTVGQAGLAPSRFPVSPNTSIGEAAMKSTRYANTLRYCEGQSVVNA